MVSSLVILGIECAKMERFTTTIEAQKEATMNEVTTIGLDVAKHTFQVVGCDRHGHEVRRKGLRRGQVRAYFATLPACVVGIEACASAHFGRGSCNPWAMRCA